MGLEKKEKEAEEKLKKSDLERKESRKIRFGTEEVDKKDAESKKSDVEKKEEVVKKDENTEITVVEVKKIKPPEPEVQDDIEIIEEFVPKTPSKPLASEPGVISLEM